MLLSPSGSAGSVLFSFYLGEIVLNLTFLECFVVWILRLSSSGCRFGALSFPLVKLLS